MNRGVERVPECDPFCQITINFLIKSLGSFTCGVIDREGKVAKVESPAAGAVGGITSGSVGSVGEGDEEPPPVSVEGGVGGV